MACCLNCVGPAAIWYSAARDEETALATLATYDAIPLGVPVGPPLGTRIGSWHQATPARLEVIAQNDGLPPGIAAALGRAAPWDTGRPDSVYMRQYAAAEAWYGERSVYMRDGSIYFRYGMRLRDAADAADAADAPPAPPVPPA